MFPQLLIALILHQVVVSLQSYNYYRIDCYHLRSICEIDPDCGDGTVFFSKCESYGGSKETARRGIIAVPVSWTGGSKLYRPLLIKKGRIRYNNLISDQVSSGSQSKKNRGNVYSDYQRKALRESLYLLKQKLHDNYYKNDKVGEDGKSANIEKKSDESDTNDKRVNVIHQRVDTGLRHTPLDTVINYSADDINNLAKKYANTNRKRNELNTKYIYNSLRREVASSKDNSDGALQIEGTKRDVIDEAFDLIQALINEHKRNDISLSLAADVGTEKVKRKVLEEDSEELSNSTEVPNSKRTTDIGKSDTIQSDKTVVRDLKDDTFDGEYVSEDRIEVATPVYGDSDDIVEVGEGEDEEEGERRDNIKDREDKELGNKQERGLLVLNASTPFSQGKALEVAKELRILLWNISDHEVFHLQRVDKNNAIYLMKVDPSWFISDDNVSSVVKRINSDKTILTEVKKSTGTTIVEAAANQKSLTNLKEKKHWDKLTIFSVIVAASVLLLLSVAIGVGIIKRKGKGLTPLIFRKQEAVQDYQELCRTQMSIVNSPHPEEDTDKSGTMKSWNDDQSPYNMDITTGHVILSYMEDHLSNENRLNKEWDALCTYKADECSTLSGSDAKHATKNRYRDVLPYDHNRVKLRETSNAFHSDYVNASFITDTNPKTPSYIATQGPLDNTVADFWQMIWEQGVVVIINLTRLSDMGLPQCHHYWPSDGSEVYHIYEVHLISEHIWCDDYLVRSLYLKNLQTAETRTVTQFHYLTWPDLSIPSLPGPLLEFRRKVNKCYRGHACPVIVHCNNGVGRTGTYILIDMVLNRMIKGTKEIDIAATLEHLRDQRQDLVKTKGQFEFALLAVAQEVSTILDAVAKK